MKPLKFKIYLCFLLTSGLIVSCRQNNDIVIKGNIEGLNTKLVYLRNVYPIGSKPFDSARVLNHKFEFRFHPDTIFQPNLVTIEYTNDKKQPQSLAIADPILLKQNKLSRYVSFIMEKGNTVLTGSLDTIELLGGKQNEFYFKNLDLPFIRISKDSIRRRNQAERLQKLVHQTPDAYWAIFAFENLKYNFNKAQLNTIYVEFSDQIKQSYEGKLLKKFIDFKPKSNDEFADTQLLDLNNKPIDLIDKTKTLNMVIFWASWCGPCRMEIPALKRIAAKIQSESFRMVSVSVDDKKDRWLESVNKEKMPWQQLIIQPKKKEQANAQYNLGFIPQIFLVDNRNKVIKKVDGFDENNEDRLITFIHQHLSNN